jgi:hypothetical protein
MLPVLTLQMSRQEHTLVRVPLGIKSILLLYAVCLEHDDSS